NVAIVEPIEERASFRVMLGELRRGFRAPRSECSNIMGIVVQKRERRIDLRPTEDARHKVSKGSALLECREPAVKTNGLPGAEEVETRSIEGDARAEAR